MTLYYECSVFCLCHIAAYLLTVQSQVELDIMCYMAQSLEVITA